MPKILKSVPNKIIAVEIRYTTENIKFLLKERKKEIIELTKANARFQLRCLKIKYGIFQKNTING